MDDIENSASALENFANNGGVEGAENVARAFELAGDRISNALTRAARTGELSFNSLAESVARDLARLAEHLVGARGHL